MKLESMPLQLEENKNYFAQMDDLKLERVAKFEINIEFLNVDIIRKKITAAI